MLDGQSSLYPVIRIRIESISLSVFFVPHLINMFLNILIIEYGNLNLFTIQKKEFYILGILVNKLFNVR